MDARDASGPATGVPGLLAAAARSRGDELHKALDELWGHTCHQGTIYSASPSVAWALIAFARDAESPERAAFYGILGEFASSARKAIADGRAIPCCAGGDPVDGRAIRDGVLDAHQQFTRDLGNPVAGIRAGAAALSAAFAEAPVAAANLVRDRYFVEPDTHVRREIILGMVRVHGRYPDWPGLLEAAIGLEADTGNRFFLLQAQVAHFGPDATVPMVSVLVATFTAFYGTYDHYLGRGDFFDAIHGLGEEREVNAMLQALGEVTGRGALLTLAQRLLSLAFRDQRTERGQTAHSQGKGRKRVNYFGLKGEAPVLPAQLSATQSEILRAIAGKAALWQFDTNVWDLFHLPATSEELARFPIRPQTRS